MYEKFYGFSEKPFHIVPNPNFFYLSPKHHNALTYLQYGIKESVGFILLTGEIGTGKTTLIRYILKQIEADIEVAVIFNTNVTANQLLGLILQEFELEADDHDKAKNLDRIHDFLIEKYASKKRVLLIIDEAQNLSEEVLEEVRMLSNLQSDVNLLLQIMLVGQPELKAKLKKPGLAQLTQRIAVNYHLTPLSREETGVYITSRLEKVGGSPDIFTKAAVEAIYHASNGTPRSINLLCDSALVYGFADQLQTIDEEVVAQVLEDKEEMGSLSAAPADLTYTASEVAPLSAGDSDLLQQRLAVLEQRVHDLGQQLNWHHEELDKRADGYRNELFQQLSRHLEQERKKNEQLLVKYGQAMERVKFLEERNTLLSSARPDASAEKKNKKSSWFSRRS